MNLVELKEFIDAHHCSDDASWQRLVFDNLFERFSVIPIASGVYKGSTSEEIATERKACDPKAVRSDSKTGSSTAQNAMPLNPIGVTRLASVQGQQVVSLWWMSMMPQPLKTFVVRTISIQSSGR